MSANDMPGWDCDRDQPIKPMIPARRSMQLVLAGFHGAPH
jgi:hypothetical protein